MQLLNSAEISSSKTNNKPIAFQKTPHVILRFKMIITIAGQKIHNKLGSFCSVLEWTIKYKLRKWLCSKLVSSQFQVTEPHTVPTTFHYNDLSATEWIHLLKMLLVLSILFYEEHALTLLIWHSFQDFKMQMKFHASTLTLDNWELPISWIL